MSYSAPFLFVKKACHEAVAEVMQQLTSVNLQVMQTFDLQKSRTTFPQCTCPYHGTEQCDCQLVVILVYQGELPPASLIAHGHDGKTWFELVDSTGQPDSPRVVTDILQALKKADAFSASGD